MKSKSIELSKKIGGKIETKSKQKLTKENLKTLYTPGVADVSLAISKNKNLTKELTIKKNSVGIISDGSAVLGLGNIGAEASLPVMEGKALLFKELGDIDAFPIVLKTQDPKEIVAIVKNISPVFGGINLEDISSPRCFEIEDQLGKELDIPVMHDDQHATAIVVLAGLINALKVVNKKIGEIGVVVSGTGAAGVAIAKLLLKAGVKNIIMTDSQGAIYVGRKNGMNDVKKEIAKITNKEKIKGSLADVLVGADVFVGVSAANILKKKDVEKMNNKAIVFALSNPVPEIMPDIAKAAGAAIVATGRSDFPNQLNNVLVFPGFFRGALDHGVKKITDKHKLAAASAIAQLIKKPTADKIIPGVFNRNVVKSIAKVIK